MFSSSCLCSSCSSSKGDILHMFNTCFGAFLVAQECPDEVFVEGVLQPCLERGRLGMLQGILEKLDPGQDSCSRYLIASCQFLQRRGYYNTLYQLQQFMMVS